jgi:LuxR family maltose regulon positive regulatory protein
VGYGKSSLVSSWLSIQTYPVTWLSLDVEDDDPLRFWIYVIAALQTVQPDLGQTALTALQTAQMPPIENILSDLINQITTLSDKIILVIDDYHLLESSSLHQGLNFFLDHMPPNMHLVLITREDPPLPLPQMRAKGEMVELRARDLRFTLEESAQFLNHKMKLDLRPDEITALSQRTEGWAAGLQMAALSLHELDESLHSRLPDYRSFRSSTRSHPPISFTNRDCRPFHTILVQCPYRGRLSTKRKDHRTNQSPWSFCHPARSHSAMV